MQYTLQGQDYSITYSDYETLVDVKDIYCITICYPATSNHDIPLERIEQEMIRNAGVDHYTSKPYGLTLEAAREHLNEVKSILKRYSAGALDHSLIILISPTEIKCFQIPLFHKFFVYVNDHFYLKPLTPLLNEDRKMMLLTLQPQKFELLFEKNTLTKHEYLLKPEKGEKCHTALFKQIDSKLFHTDSIKHSLWILTGNETLIKSYLSASRFKDSFHHILPLTPAIDSYKFLRQKAWILLNSFQRKRGESFAQKYRNKLRELKPYSDFRKIVSQAYGGNVKTLFLDKNKDVYGEYDAKNNYVFGSNSSNDRGASLSNLAAVYTALNNGDVYMIDSDKMPVSQKPMNAILK